MADHVFTETVAETTQVRAPWRTVVRTVFQGLVALAAVAPFAVDAVNDGAEATGAAAAFLAVSAAVTRLMAVPGVEKFLRDYLPFLAAGAKD